MLIRRRPCEQDAPAAQVTVQQCFGSLGGCHHHAVIRTGLRGLRVTRVQIDIVRPILEGVRRVAIPSSSLPGHRALHERAVAALSVCAESQDVDFKESATWDALRWKITRTVLGMGNLRDGGLVICGVSEREDSWSVDGMIGSDLATYDADKILGHVDAYVSPFADLDVVLLEHDSRKFLVVGVREFRDTPLVCLKNGPDGAKLKQGVVYVRPAGVPRTSQVMDAREMHYLLELAAEKRAKRMLEAARRIGLTEQEVEAASARYDAELGGL